jgi:hypothetical protein
MSKTNTARQISEVLGAQGLHTIGALVFWTLSGVRIARDELAEALNAIGLGAAMVRKPTPHAALATAIKRVGMGRKGILFRQVKREWALVFERGGGKRLLLAHDATFRVNAEGAIEVECMHDGEIPELHNLRMAIEAQYQEVLDYVSSSDLSAVLCTAMQGVGSETMLGGLSLRQSAGGLYYVSAAKLDTLKEFARVVSEAAPQSSIEVLTLTGDAENLEAAARNVRGNITTQLKQAREEIGEFLEHLQKDSRSARADSIAVRAEQFRQIKARVELFADVLGESMAELQQQVETARTELMSKLEAA